MPQSYNGNLLLPRHSSVLIPPKYTLSGFVDQSGMKISQSDLTLITSFVSANGVIRFQSVEFGQILSKMEFQ